MLISSFEINSVIMETNNSVMVNITSNERGLYYNLKNDTHLRYEFNLFS